MYFEKKEKKIFFYIFHNYSVRLIQKYNNPKKKYRYFSNIFQNTKIRIFFNFKEIINLVMKRDLKNNYSVSSGGSKRTVVDFGPHIQKINIISGKRLSKKRNDLNEQNQVLFSSAKSVYKCRNFFFVIFINEK